MIKPKKIIKTRRRSIALIVNGQGELVVRAPYYASETDIISFVEKKQGWIQKQQLLVAQELREFKALSLAENSSLDVQGRTYYIAKRAIDKIILQGNALLLPVDCTTQQLLQWLKEQLLLVLLPSVAYYAGVMGVVPKSVQLSNAKTKWGSCSYANALRFSWRLIFCPPDVLDYLVVHELTHIKNKSHNRLFWQQVEDTLPNYKEQEKWLKTHRKVMEIL